MFLNSSIGISEGVRATLFLRDCRKRNIIHRGGVDIKWSGPMLLHRNKTCLRNINASLTIKKQISKLFTEKQRRTNSYSRITSSSEPKFECFSV